MPPGITDSNQELLELLSQAVHQIAHATAEIAENTRVLREAWERNGAMIDAYQRGGLLAMRSARKAGNGAVPANR